MKPDGLTGHPTGPSGSGADSHPQCVQPWHGLRARFSAVLDSLPEGHVLILSTSADSEVPDAYVQFRAVEIGLYCEAVSNVYLPAEHGLGPDAEDELRRLGWSDPADTGNWWTELRGPERAELAAGLAVRTLRDVYGHHDPAELSVLPAEMAVPLEVMPHRESDVDEEDLDDVQRFAVMADRFGAYVGTSTEEVHSVVVDDEYFRIVVDDLGPVVMVSRSVLVEAGYPQSASRVDELRRLASAAGDYGIERTVDEEGSESVWLVSRSAVEPDDESLENAMVECWQLAEAARWASVALGNCSGGR